MQLDPDTLRISTDPTGAVVVSGDVDVVSSDRLADALRRADRPDVTVDLSAVTFLDSSGVAVLVTALRELSARRGCLRVRSASRPAWRTMQLTGSLGLLAADRVN